MGNAYSDCYSGPGLILGQNGNCRKLIPLNIKNVQDIIAKYDEILKIVENFPRYPNYGYFSDNKGHEIYYQSFSPTFQDK